MTCNIPVDRVVRPDSTFSFGVLEVLSVAVYTKGALCSESLAAAVSAVARRSTKNRIDITQLISGFINTHRNNPPKPHTLFSISNFLPRFYPPATKPAHNDILTSRASSCQHNGYGIFRFSPFLLWTFRVLRYCLFPPIVYMRICCFACFCYPTPEAERVLQHSVPASDRGECSLIPYSLVVSLPGLAWPGLGTGPDSCWDSGGDTIRCVWSSLLVGFWAAGKKDEFCWAESDRAQEAWHFRILFFFFVVW